MNKDVTKLTKEEWLNIIPCKIYNKKENKSYLIISLSKEGLYYNEEIQVEDDDDFSWSYYRTIDVSVLLDFKKLTNDFVIGDEPTEKQIEWLKRYDKMTSSMTKQEAWKIINKAVSDYQAKVKTYNKKAIEKYVSNTLNRMLNAEDIIGQCGGCFDDDYYCGGCFEDDYY